MGEIFSRQFRGLSVPPEHLQKLLQPGLVVLKKIGEAPVTEQLSDGTIFDENREQKRAAEATCRIRAAFNSSCTHFDFTAAGESTIRKYFASEMPLLIFLGMLSPSRTSSLSYQTGTARGRVRDEPIHEILSLLA